MRSWRVRNGAYALYYKGILMQGSQKIHFNNKGLGKFWESGISKLIGGWKGFYGLVHF